MKNRIVAFLSCVTLLLATATVFADTFNPKIYQVYVDDNGLMTILGTGFPEGGRVQTLKVGGIPATGIVYDGVADSVQAQVPAELGPGDYRLLVNFKLNNNAKNVIWDLSIGAMGPQGEQGKVGEPGAPGEQGPQGKLGNKGQPGAPGDQGPQGKLGAAGEPGEQGVQGKIGPPGADSTVAGPQGEQGKIGPPGADSTVAGPQGVQGKMGPPGADSTVAGPQGEQGKIGPPGQDGQIGAQGPAGPAPETRVIGNCVVAHTGPLGNCVATAQCPTNSELISCGFNQYSWRQNTIKAMIPSLNDNSCFLSIEHNGQNFGQPLNVADVYAVCAP